MAELKNWLSPLISDLSWDTSFLFITTTVWILGSDTVPWTASIISLAQEQQNKGKLPFYDWLPAATLQGHPTTVFSLMLLDAVLGYLEYF